MDPDPGGPKTHGSGSATLEQTLTECSAIFSLTWGGTWSPAGRPSQVLRWRSTRGSTSRASNPAPSISRHQAAHITSAETAIREHCSLSVPVRVLLRHVTCFLPGFFWLADESPLVISELLMTNPSSESCHVVCFWPSGVSSVNRLSWQEEDSSVVT